MKRILHLTYDMRIGGTETVIKNLVEGTDSNLYETEILCLEPQLGPFGQQLKQQGVKVSNLGWVDGFDRNLIKQIRDYIKSNNVDILHCHQYTPWVYGTLAAAFTNTNVIFTEHGRFYPDSSSWKRKLVNPILLKGTSQVTAISEATKRALVEFEFIPESKIDVIYNGIRPLVADVEKVTLLKQEFGISNATKVVGTVARLDPIKNQPMMIRAFANMLIKHKDVKLIIVGDGEEREHLESIVDELAIRESVIFTGYIAEPVNHIALMDIFLLSSFSEGTSMTLLEAMSLGKPCVVTDVGGNPEVIADGFNGVVVESDNALAFSDGIATMLSKIDKEGVSLSTRALQRYQNLFSCEKMNADFSKYYG